jgi:hypothetical protein
MLASAVDLVYAGAGRWSWMTARPVVAGFSCSVSRVVGGGQRAGWGRAAQRVKAAARHRTLLGARRRRRPRPAGPVPAGPPERSSRTVHASGDPGDVVHTARPRPHSGSRAWLHMEMAATWLLRGAVGDSSGVHLQYLPAQRTGPGAAAPSPRADRCSTAHRDGDARDVSRAQLDRTVR